ncbi:MULTISPECIES: hypothetical protein [Bacillati]|uniref:Uncharacterized protein n=1 Tax=Arthrobacter russicus TaxID=172040 RepID=A0ABU1J947_9MICC|nr:hypothetical protein [Arthrobacter russicus]MDR6268938.1 hypothetical protein [Arthrobacter russicus]MDR6270577.1 hypothetical protein [Arthrobacter russicus]
MFTNATAAEYVISAIENGDASREDFNVEAIASDLHDIAGCWNVAEVDADEFWTVVERHAR